MVFRSLLQGFPEKKTIILVEQNAKKGLEFISKYGDRGYITSSQLNSLRSITVDDQPSQQFATEAWTSRNAFRTILRQLQNLEENIIDSKLMMNPEAKRFGR